MKKFEVEIGLQRVGEARRAWGAAQATFNAQVETLMGRFLNEAAVNKMSVEAVAEHVGMTPTKTRALMRRHGLNPKTGRNLLAKQAAETLEENAALLGVEPHEFDLMSPLVYLPMGEDLRRFLETRPADLDEIENDWDEDLLVKTFQAEWHRADSAGLAGSRTKHAMRAVLAAIDGKVTA